MIGLPLRLLAREVYDRMTARIGEHAVALVTGEEKRVPRHPRYWICTVEAMPMDRNVDFLAVDEIQLGTNRERGHIFTDRLLHARGRLETWFLGSETVRPLVERLLPTARVRNHPRLSKLNGTPPSGLSSLPKRSAVVAFSSQRVYEIAERIRHKHGGAALVLGALSPRTRNAQVALYQSGEVDYLVATDAIGMGLNLDIRHVAFADLTKFDGRESRALELAELAQIAGRAGRYLDDGSFGVLAPLGPLGFSSMRALERHRFPAETQLYWRNSRLDLSSVEALVASLRDSPPRRELRSIEPAADHRALLALCAKPSIQGIATTPERLALLWEICQIPDYPQLLFELHVKLLEEVFVQLTGPRQRLDETWIDALLRRIDHVEGDIETLMGHIAEIRTWNYVSQHPQWVDNARQLADRTRDIEDRLSDALHARLVARFVERRRGFSQSIIAAPSGLRPGQKQHPFAQLLATHGLAQPTLLEPLAEQARFTDRLVEAPHEQFQVDVAGRLTFEARRVGTLLAGTDLLHPEVQVRLEPDPGRGACARVQRRLLAFCRDLVEQLLLPLRKGDQAAFSGAARGLLYQLEQGLGTVRIAGCQGQLAELGPHERQVLASLGLRYGQSFLYVRRLLDAKAIAQRLALVAPHWSLDLMKAAALTTCIARPNPANLPAVLLTAVGFTEAGPLLLRVDSFERLVSELRNCARAGSFQAPRDLPTRLHCEPEDIAQLLTALGYQQQGDGRWAGRQRPLERHGDARRRRRARPYRPGNERVHSPTDSSSEA
jgi:ATP-dependent RNA helicase SUPV3L1/SUV3